MPTKKRKQKDVHAVPAESVSSHILHSGLSNIFQATPEEFCIRQPPANVLMTDFPDKVPNLYVPALDPEIFDLAAHLRAIQKGYVKTRNGMYLLSAFLLAHERRLYPPMWVLEAIATSFKNYFRAPATKPLDTWLGLRGGPGQEPAPQASARRARAIHIAHDMWLLQHKFGLTIDQTAEVVQKKLDASPLTFRWGERLNSTFTHGSLTKLYSTQWQKEFELTKEQYDLIAPHFPQTFWRGFLKDFPTRDLKANLKAKLRLD